MQRWRGDGRCDGLGSSELRRQTRTDANRRLKGPKNSKGNSRPRYEHAAIEVANIVKKHSKLLRLEGKRDAPPGPTMPEEIAQLKKEAKKKEADLEAARLSARREGDAKRQLKSRLIAKKSAVSEARKEEKAKAKAKAKEVKAQQDKEVRKRIDAAVERLVERRAAQEQLSQEQRIDELLGDGLHDGLGEQPLRAARAVAGVSVISTVSSQSRWRPMFSGEGPPAAAQLPRPCCFSCTSTHLARMARE